MTNRDVGGFASAGVESVIDAPQAEPLYAAPGHAPPPGRFSSERES
jgi:hypothetical protein